MKVLVVDVGGSHVKVRATGQSEAQSFDSHADLTAQETVDRVREMTRDWNYEVVSLGFPGYTGFDGPEEEPGNLGNDWVGFDFEAAFEKPTLVINDAAMQALGAYDSGRMLFLGLGTGLGSAIVSDSVVLPLELGSLTWRKNDSLFDRLGKAGRKKYGHDEWMRVLNETILNLQKAFKADYVVLGGGNAKKVDDPLLEGVRRGGNEDAFKGGLLLWHDEVHHHGPDPDHWRVVR